MSRTSESNDDFFLCVCGKCLAKNMEIRCKSCKHDNPIPVDTARLLATMTARTLAANVTVQHKLTGDLPVTITIHPTSHYSGMVQFSDEPVLRTLDTLRHGLTATMAQVLTEAEFCKGAGYGWTMQHAYDLAKRILEIEGKNGNSPQQLFALVEEHQTRAQALLVEHREAIELLSTELQEKGTLDSAALNALFSAKK